MVPPYDIQPSSFLVTQCQEDVERLLTALRSLGNISELPSWSEELGTAYDMAVDGIIAISLHLRVYSLSLQKTNGTTDTDSLNVASVLPTSHVPAQPS